MTYFPDLSPYEYSGHFSRPGTQNVGWLDDNHGFSAECSPDEVLDRLWACCKISVAQMRGIHCCELCGGGTYVDRLGETLWLGSAEVRLFGDDGVIYAAPTLIYHYVSSHHYRPPDGFLKALSNGPLPPSQSYFVRLSELDLVWRQTSSPPEQPERIMPTTRGKFGQTDSD